VHRRPAFALRVVQPSEFNLVRHRFSTGESNLMFKRDSGTHSVEERLGRLERENRKLKILVVTALVLVVAAFSTGMAAQSGSYRYLEANTFVLKDSAGHIRGQWTAQGTSSGFTLNDDPEQPVMELLNSPEYHATKLSLIGPKGVVSLWATNDDASLIVK
jgi:hypothetical protein